MRTTIAILLVLVSISVFSYRGYRKTIFKKEVTGYLVRAANASSVKIAKGELKIALDYLEANNMTSGYTSALYNTPDEDIAFWYTNLKSSYDGLNEADSASSLEKTNLLIKLRETIMVRGGEGREKVTVPDALYLHPNNVAWAWGTLLALGGLFGGLLLFIPPEEWKKGKNATNNAT